MKLILVLIISVITNLAFGQDTTHIRMINTNSPNPEWDKSNQRIHYDSIDNSAFCKQKLKEYEALQKRLDVKLDSLKSEVEILRQKHPGLNYFIEERVTKHFDWEGCFQTWIPTAHGWRPVDADFRISEADKSHNNPDGSSGWTIYFDEIQRLPKY